MPSYWSSCSLIYYPPIIMPSSCLLSIKSTTYVHQVHHVHYVQQARHVHNVHHANHVLILQAEIPSISEKFHLQTDMGNLTDAIASN